MTNTREENAAEMARDEARRASMVPVYVIVTGEPSDSDDYFTPGFYQINVDPDLTDEQKADTALDIFHDNNGIACLEDFTITVFDADGKTLSGAESHEHGSFWNHGEYIGDFDNPEHLPPAVQAALNASGPTGP